MTSIAISRMLLDGPYAVGCRYNLDDALLAAQLRQLGVDARLYAGKSEGRIVDLARQFVRMRTQACLFTVEPVTLALTQQIVAQLRALVPAIEVFFQGPVDAVQRQALSAGAPGVHWLNGDADARLAELAKRLGTEAASSADPALASPYLAGLVHEDEAVRLGLCADRPLALLAQELAWLAARPAGEARIPVAAGRCGAAELPAVVDLIRNAGTGARFVLTLRDEQHSAALAQAVAGDDQVVLAVAGDAAAPSSRYGINGVMALHTGIYADASPAAGMRHLEVGAALSAEQRRAAYDWAAPHLMSRSAVVFQRGADGSAPGLDAFTLPLPHETGGWPMHSYVVERGQAGLATVAFDGRPSPALAIRHLPFAALASADGADAAGDVVTYVSMKETADVEAFEQRLRLLGERGQVRIEQARQRKYLENSCRWTRRGTCQLTALKRVQVSPSLRLSSCRDAGDIGAVGDAFDDIVVRLKREQQTQGIRRECAVCPVRDDCSQCTQLPADWAGRYCEIRKAQPLASLYIEIFTMAAHLATLFGVAAGDALELRVSYTGLPRQHFTGPAGTPREGARPVILSCGERHIAWWRGTSRLCRMSGPMALMAEAWWSSGDEDDVVGDLAARFDVPTEVASQSLRTGVDKLRSEGIVHA